MSNLIFLAALLPPLFLIRYVNKLDQIEKEPASLLRRLFFLGAVGILPAIILEMIFDGIFGGGLQSPGTWQLVLENFIGVALVEEGVKYFFLRRSTWNHPAFNYRFDGIVYAVVVSMGFAAAENIMYSFLYGLSVALFRAVTSIPGHAVFAIYMGYYYGCARHACQQGDDRATGQYRRLSLVVPVLLHGFYDFALSTRQSWMVVIFFVYIIVLDLIAFRNLRRFSREDGPLGTEEWNAVSGTDLYTEHERIDDERL